MSPRGAAYLGLTVLVAWLAYGCASLTPKQRATQGLQTVHTLLSDAQAAEIALYNAGRPDTPTLPQLTDARHLAFHRALVVAFDAEFRAATALQAWRAGDPVPSSLDELLTAGREALAVLQQVGPDRVQSALAVVQRVLAEVEALVDRLRAGGDVPPGTVGPVDTTLLSPVDARFLTAAFALLPTGAY